MPHDPVTVRSDVVLKDTFGAHDMVVTTQHEGLPGNQQDFWKEFDIWAANAMQSLLLARRPGYPWACRHDSFQGFARINIPILTGVAGGYVINLKTHEVTDSRVLYGADLLLERYGLRRGRMQLGAFLDARAKHSGLVVQSRRIPA